MKTLLFLFFSLFLTSSLFSSGVTFDQILNFNGTPQTQCRDYSTRVFEWGDNYQYAGSSAQSIVDSGCINQAIAWNTDTNYKLLSVRDCAKNGSNYIFFWAKYESKNITLGDLKACPAGEDLDFTDCSCKTSCTPESQPQNKTPILHDITLTECNDFVTSGNPYISNGTAYNSLQCWTDTCGDLESWTLYGVLETCSPLSGFPLPNITQSECFGSLIDYPNLMKFSSMSWNSCDSICYGLEMQFLSCSDQLATASASCDATTNDFIYVCDDEDMGVNGTLGVINETDTKCVPTTSPCETELNNLRNTCDLSTHRIIGGCNDNGMIILSSDLECVLLPPPECSAVHHLTLDANQTSCICESGYTMDSFGDCVQNLPDSNTTDPDDTNPDDTLGDNNSTAPIAQDGNTTTNQSLGRIEELLNAIRGDINSTNSILGDISSKLDRNSTTSDSNSSDSNTTLRYIEDANQTANRNAVDSILSSFYAITDDIQSDYNNLTQILNGGLPSPTMSTGCAPTFSGTAFGRPISINLCEIFSHFFSIFYYIFSLMFMLTAVKLFYTAFKMR
ncbi:MAG: hypothetical protein PHU40_05160 [Sulfurimonas sp.]|nr:hypothetical protein [Sulfurimonas sp.]